MPRAMVVAMCMCVVMIVPVIVIVPAALAVIMSGGLLLSGACAAYRRGIGPNGVAEARDAATDFLKVGPGVMFHHHRAGGD